MSVKVSAVLVLVEHTFQKENLQVDDVVEPLLESTEKVLVQFPFSLNLKKKVLFCSLLFFIEFPNYKIYSGCRSSGPLLPRSGSLVQLGQKSLQWVSDGEHSSKNMESDDEHTHKNINNDVCNIDQSTLDIGHHFAPFAKLFV